MYTGIKMTLCLLAGAVIGYFAAEMMLKKSFRVFRKKAWIGLGVTCLALLAFVGAFEGDLFGYEGYLPEAEEVERVEVYAFGEMNILTSETAIADVLDLHGAVIRDKGYQERIAETHNSSTVRTEITYILRNGRIISRSYYLRTPNGDLAEDSVIRQVADTLNQPEFVVARLSSDIGVNERTISDCYISRPGYEDGLTLTIEQAQYLYTECILPDAEAGNLGKIDPEIWLWGYTAQWEEEEYLTSFNVHLSLSLKNEDGQIVRWDDLYINVPYTAERSKAYIQELVQVADMDTESAPAISSGLAVPA